MRRLGGLMVPRPCAWMCLLHPKSDVMRDNTFNYLLALAASGTVVAVMEAHLAALRAHAGSGNPDLDP